MARGRGRPSIFEDPKVEKQLKAYMRVRPTLNDTAAFFDVHPDTIEKHIKKKYKKKFSEFRETYMVHTRFNVVRALLRAAEGGNVKAIELALSYFCKWQNKIEQETTGKIDIQYNVIPPKND